MTNENWEEVKLPWVKWGLVGDNIEGTLVGVSDKESHLPGKEGQMQKVYEIKADRGSFHDIDEKKNPVKEATTIAAGEIYSVGGKDGMDAQMKRIKIGQKVRISFTEERAAQKKGFNAFKLIKVMTNGAMDQEWLDGREVTAGDM